MQTRTLSSLALIAAAALVAACSSDETGSGSTGSGGSTSVTSTTATTTGATTTTGTGATTTTSSTGSGPECHGPGFNVDPAIQQLGTVSATVTDLDGTPAASMPIQLCGLDICLFGDTDAGGFVSINANKMLDTPAFKYGDGNLYPRFATPVPDTTDIAFGTLLTAKLPVAGATMTAGSSATSGDVTLTFAAETDIEFDEISFGEPDQQKLRVVTIPIEKAPPAIDASLGLELLYGAGPFETIFCPPAEVSVTNTAGWAAGTEVELFVHGVSVLEDYAPYAGWAKVSDGKVSADGTKIVTNAGEGLPTLSVFGIRQKP